MSATAISRPRGGLRPREVRPLVAGLVASLIASLIAGLVVLGLSSQAAAADRIAPPVLSVSGGKVTWPAVSRADGYNIYKAGSYLTTVTATSYTATSSGSYSATSFDNGVSPTEYSVNSAPVNVTVSATGPMAAPALSVSGAKITWPAVSRADGYNIYKAGSYLTTVTATSYTATSSGSYSATSYDNGVSPTQYSVNSAAVNVTVPPTGVSWTDVFVEDFNSLDTARWEAPTWASAKPYGDLDNRDFVNNIAQCTTSGGALKLQAQVVNGQTRSCYLATRATFGPTTTKNMKIEFKVDLSQNRAAGAWFAGWASSLGNLAEDNNPATGQEVDVVEHVPYSKPGYTTSNWIHPAVHDGFSREATTAEGAVPGEGGMFDAASARLGGLDIRNAGWHTYGVEWNKTCQIFSVDGKPYWKATTGVSTATNHRVLVTLEVDSGTAPSGNNIWGRPVGDFQVNVASQPSIARVDQVRVATRNYDASICSQL